MESLFGGWSHFNAFSALAFDRRLADPAAAADFQCDLLDLLFVAVTEFEFSAVDVHVAAVHRTGWASFRSFVINRNEDAVGIVHDGGVRDFPDPLH